MKLTRADLPKLDAFIEDYSQNDVAYYWRGTVEACALTPPKLQDASRDLQMYETKEHTDLFPPQQNQVLPLLAKIDLSEDHTLSALQLMKRAANADTNVRTILITATPRFSVTLWEDTLNEQTSEIGVSHYTFHPHWLMEGRQQK